MKKTASVVSVILGIIFVILAVVYWTVPAGSLPHFMPGFETGVPTVHFKHGLASLILAIALFIYTWFSTGKKELPPPAQPTL
jgi:hypothetical protein